MEKEAKKEAFRKYLESSGVLDALTKVLVSLYEQQEKPSAAVEFIQQKLGGPPLAEYEKLQAEFSELQLRYNDLLAVQQEKCQEKEVSKIQLRYEKLQAEHSDLQLRYNELLAVHQGKCQESEEPRNTHVQSSPKETTQEEAPTEGL